MNSGTLRSLPPVGSTSADPRPRCYAMLCSPPPLCIGARPSFAFLLGQMVDPARIWTESGDRINRVAVSCVPSGDAGPPGRRLSSRLTISRQWHPRRRRSRSSLSLCRDRVLCYLSDAAKLVVPLRLRVNKS